MCSYRYFPHGSKIPSSVLSLHIWIHLEVWLFSWYWDRWSFFCWGQNQPLTLLHNRPSRHVPPVLCYQSTSRADMWMSFVVVVALFPFSLRKKKKKKTVWQETNQDPKENEILAWALENLSVDLVQVPYGSNFDYAVVQAGRLPALVRSSSGFIATSTISPLRQDAAWARMLSTPFSLQSPPAISAVSLAPSFFLILQLVLKTCKW